MVEHLLLVSCAFRGKERAHRSTFSFSFTDCGMNPGEIRLACVSFDFLLVDFGAPVCMSACVRRLNRRYRMVVSLPNTFVLNCLLCDCPTRLHHSMHVHEINFFRSVGHGGSPSWQAPQTFHRMCSHKLMLNRVLGHCLEHVLVLLLEDNVYSSKEAKGCHDHES